MAQEKPEAEPHCASLPLEEACVSPCLAAGDTVVVTNKCGNMDGKYLEMTLPQLRGGTKPSTLDYWTDLPWFHHLPADHNITAGQAEPDLSLFQLSLALHRHLDVLAVFCRCHRTWGWGGDSATPLCLKAQHRGGGLGQ